jgi:hypothetical protein
MNVNAGGKYERYMKVERVRCEGRKKIFGDTYQ